MEALGRNIESNFPLRIDDAVREPALRLRRRCCLGARTPPVEASAPFPLRQTAMPPPFPLRQQCRPRQKCRLRQWRDRKAARDCKAAATPSYRPPAVTTASPSVASPITVSIQPPLTLSSRHSRSQTCLPWTPLIFISDCPRVHLEIQLAFIVLGIPRVRLRHTANPLCSICSPESRLKWGDVEAAILPLYLTVLP